MTVNSGQADGDHDGVGDACDNSPSVPNPSQTDTDGDGVGDASDNCPTVVNLSQADADGDSIGDACDNCPTAWNPSQADANNNGVGDACEAVCKVFRRDLGTVVEDQMIAGGTKADRQWGPNIYALTGDVNGESRHALFKFDLSALPAGALVTSADVRIRVFANPVQPTPLATIRAHRITANWSESTVTYNTFKNAFAPQVNASFSNGAGGIVAQFSLTPLVQSWVNGTYPNYGFLLEQTQVSGQSTNFKTSESTGGHDEKPEMTVCYTIPG
ncbi:MAG: DNRLRE domain-containing protein [Minicystis sp.]